MSDHHASFNSSSAEGNGGRLQEWVIVDKCAASDAVIFQFLRRSCSATSALNFNKKWGATHFRAVSSPQPEN